MRLREPVQLVREGIERYSLSGINLADMAVINIYKPIGATPLDMIDLLREERPDLVDEKMTYAGRLDPLAEGVLIILSGQDRFQKPKYLKLDKEYRADVCFGITTDTFDLMGMVENVIKPSGALGDKNVFKQFEGKNVLPYPPFSSYKVSGKPLFAWAKAGRLNEITIPLKTMVVNRIQTLKRRRVGVVDVAQSAIEKVGRVTGEFRQDKIINIWRKVADTNDLMLPLYTISVQCESGTYIRSLAHEAGRRVGSGACLYGLKRTSVGGYDSKDSIHLC